MVNLGMIETFRQQLPRFNFAIIPRANQMAKQINRNLRRGKVVELNVKFQDTILCINGNYDRRPLVKKISNRLGASFDGFKCRFAPDTKLANSSTRSQFLAAIASNNYAKLAQIALGDPAFDLAGKISAKEKINFRPEFARLFTVFRFDGQASKLDIKIKQVLNFFEAQSKIGTGVKLFVITPSGKLEEIKPNRFALAKSIASIDFSPDSHKGEIPGIIQILSSPALCAIADRIHFMGIDFMGKGTANIKELLRILHHVLEGPAVLEDANIFWTKPTGPNEEVVLFIKPSPSDPLTIEVTRLVRDKETRKLSDQPPIKFSFPKI